MELAGRGVCAGLCRRRAFSVTEARSSAQFPDVGQSASSSEPPESKQLPPRIREVYESEFEFVARTVRRLGVAERDLADAVHDVFDVVIRKWGEYDQTRPLRSWVFGIARRVAAAHRRRVRQRREQPLTNHPDPANPETDAACRELLQTLLDGLDEDRRVAFVLHDLEGYSGPEIAEMLEVPMNTVYSRVRLARQELSAQVRRMRMRRAI